MHNMTFQSTLANGWFPMNNAAIVCKAGISKGKLKGVMTETPPNGKRYLVWEEEQGE